MAWASPSVVSSPDRGVASAAPLTRGCGPAPAWQTLWWNQDVDAAISITGLRVVRGGVPVIPGLDVEVERGRVTGLLGPSGSGKSTLMRAIVGVADRRVGGR